LPSFHSPISSVPLCRRGSGLGLSTPDLGGLALLDGLLRLADGGGAGDGVLAEIGAVVAVGGRLDDGGVCLVALAGLLGQEDNAALLAGLDTNGLWNILVSESVVRRRCD
jgi:hypothetical protein